MSSILFTTLLLAWEFVLYLQGISVTCSLSALMENMKWCSSDYTREQPRCEHGLVGRRVLPGSVKK